jgi:RNA polymerase sigma-70 factor, ECF subfamily
MMADRVLAIEQTGDNVLESAVREHARLVYRIAHSVLRNSAEAEDAVQDTFLRLLRYGRKAAAIEDMKAWLARIAWRVAVERRERVAKATAGHETQPDDLAAPSQIADRVLIESERKEALHRFIAALPDSLRDPLVLGAIEELSPREIAEVLGITEASVRSRAFRARQLLRERMSAWMGDTV